MDIPVLSLETEIDKAVAAAAVTKAVEERMIAKHGEVVTALLGAMAQLSFIYSSSVCPSHGTPECTCDPTAALHRALSGLSASMENMNNLLNVVIPQVAPKADMDSLTGDVKEMFLGIEEAWAILHPELAELTPEDGTVELSQLHPEPGTLQ